ncbi:GIY-YIG nuclease family protein [Aquicoccus sp. G2-2]|uniref:GIY-YIG nuclease family protein n=1 Tax=Aquicoccus sp. G2-2 TaxID=3092120 RepID=UPI002ADFAC63|nr:GIY-YIG nuclease family protein [Aquicoccus sp. G2-2]MEA1113337.1 GIY-YIG nuclease family protein [Aquicoccus sp. G2-2]
MPNWESSRQTKKTATTPTEARVIAGFEDIQKFFEEHGRAPEHGADRDIFERLYAVRLDRLRAQSDCVALLAPLDDQGLLTTEALESAAADDDRDDAALLAALGVDQKAEPSITELRHVRPSTERKAAEEIAARTPCSDFSEFSLTFDAVRADIASGRRQTRPFERKSEIEKGRFFVVDGLIAYVAEAGEEFRNDSGNIDRRLRVIYDNATENNLLARSLQKALTQDPLGRRITDPEAGPLFDRAEPIEGRESGTIYVLQSLSDHPTIVENRNLIHKIGVTGGDVNRRIANAEKEPTFLMAPVKIVATFSLYDINRVALENLLHRFFSAARLETRIPDRLGNEMKPREWFFVPLHAILEAVERIQDGSLHQYVYCPEQARLAKR